ncbi:hypothetical protein FGG08_003287 [Glutinoglossum americanum]|uniref:C2H2-type domain-containing protein n=1 Tax=Glutinoglossum americanum TaxID=1670608 RepID=A0A9P8IA36_9PEZI|nr:hypothetical protein FGG08_003287 [Glutinoglossum americanum]
MGKKGLTLEEIAKRAREKGFSDDITGIDDTQILKPITAHTERLYDRRWNIYTKTHPNVSPHDMQTAKHFVEFLACCAEGVNSDKPTVSSIRMYWRQFISAWERRTSDPISKKIKESITYYIQGHLQKKLALPATQRQPHYLTTKVFVILLKQLWQNDWYEYHHESSRVRFTAALQLCCYTSGRIGEFFESSVRPGSNLGLYYKDITFVIRWDNDRKPEIVVKILRNYAKGMTNTPLKRPMHSIYEKTDTLLVNPVLFLLAIALADNAFRDYSTLEEILAIEPPADEDLYHIEWKDDILDMPFFRTATFEGPTNKIQKSNSFSHQLVALGRRAGYEENITVHDARREALIKADDGYSIAERMKFAGHIDSSTFLNSYMAQISTVDGQASFLGQKLRGDHIEDLRGMSLRRHPQLWHSLPAKIRCDLECRSDLIALQKDIDTLTEKIVQEGSKQDRVFRQQLYDKKRRIITIELRKQQALQPRRLKSHTAHETHLEDFRRTLFSRTHHLMPERSRLASYLLLPVALRSPEGRCVLADLISLCTQDSRVAYQSSLQPKMGNCPVPKCLLRTDRTYLESRYGFAQLCFQCDKWITDEAKWDQHCQSHLDKPELLPLRCEPLVFRLALACAGYCPFCLGNPRLPASERLHQFMYKNRWLPHIGQHVRELDSDKAVKCLHPGCAISFGSVQDLLYHFEDIHGIKFTEATTKRKLYFDSEDDVSRVKKSRRASRQDKKSNDLLYKKKFKIAKVPPHLSVSPSDI